MNNDITSIFKEKNKEIFKKSLTLEMDRNLESLKNTTDNCVSLEINKLFLFFKSFFQEEKIDFKKEELLGVLYKERKELNDIVNKKIEEKKSRVLEYFSNVDKNEDVFSQEFLTNYFNKLQEETNIINEEVEQLLKEEIMINFNQDIISKYKIETPAQLERINSRVSVLFRNTVVSKITEQIVFRDESLKNMANESFKRYLELNKNTIE